MPPEVPRRRRRARGAAGRRPRRQGLRRERPAARRDRRGRAGSSATAPDGWTLAARPPYDVVPSVRDLPDRSAEPDARRCTVAAARRGLAGRPAHLRRGAASQHAPDDVVVLLLDNGDVDGTRRGRPRARRGPPRPGRGAARRARRRLGRGARRRCCAPTSPRCTCSWTRRRVLEGDALTPVLAALDDPEVAGAGWRGVARPGRLDGVRGRRAGRGRGAAGLPARRAPLGRAAGAAAGEGALLPQRRHGVVVPAARGRASAGSWCPRGELPVRQDRHRGYHDSDPA